MEPTCLIVTRTCDTQPMAVQPFHGSRRDWLLEQGIVPTLIATSGRWQLRHYPMLSPSSYSIYDAKVLIGADGHVSFDLFRQKWFTYFESVQRFADTPVAAFELWVSLRSA